MTGSRASNLPMPSDYPLCTHPHTRQHNTNLKTNSQHLSSRIHNTSAHAAEPMQSQQPHSATHTHTRGRKSSTMEVDRFSVDVVIPTVRANMRSLRRAVELAVPPAFDGLKFIIVVDGPQPVDAWREMESLAAEHGSAVSLHSTRPNHHGWPAGASAARNAGIEHSHADWVLFLDDDTMPEPNLSL